MSYVPTHLTFGPRQADGWPAFVSEDGKAWAEAQAKAAIALFEGFGRDWVSLDGIREAIFTRQPGLPACFEGVALWDAQYAVAHRAALAAGLKEVWTKR